MGRLLARPFMSPPALWFRPLSHFCTRSYAQGTALVKSAEHAAVTLAWNAWEDPPPPPPVTLLLAMPRPKALRRLWKQLAELGVSRIVLTITDTVPSGYATSAALRPHTAIADILQVCYPPPPAPLQGPCIATVSRNRTCEDAGRTHSVCKHPHGVEGSDP